MFHILLRPGQEFHTFTALERRGGLTENGRPVAETFQPVGQFLGAMIRASQGELTQWKSANQWKQDGHSTLYKIIRYGGGAAPKPGDALELNGRKFYVLGVHNPVFLGHFDVYFAQERRDLP